MRQQAGFWLTLTLGSFLLVCPPCGPDNKSVDARREQLRQLISQEREYELREAPAFLATFTGDYRFNDHWGDFSLAHEEPRKRAFESWLSRFEAVDTGGFPEQEKLNQLLMVRNLREEIESIEFRDYELAVNDGIQLWFPQIVDTSPFDSTRHYEDYLVRLRQLPAVINQLIEVFRKGADDHLTPWRPLLEEAGQQCKSIASPGGEANVFSRPIAHFPDAVANSDRKRLHDDILAAVDKEVRPAYLKLSRFILTEYAPKSRREPGVWSLPQGDARYHFAIRQVTGSDMDPETIHELGLREVARIEGEQLSIARNLGFPDLKSLGDSFRSNPPLVATSREQILEIYRSYVAGMESRLPQFFGLLPHAPVDVRPVAEYAEKEAALAQYSPGTLDGLRPGLVYVNTGDYQHRSLLRAESTAYHEGVPGHHLQMSVAQTLTDLPPFRRMAGYDAYQEGWALYAEHLAKEMGFYQNSYSDYGRLSSEMVRAIRLVVDTGVHHKRWTRQQMVDFFHEHSSEDERDIQSEVDRCIGSPAQALAYKLGELEILKLRERTRTEFGNQFDIRAFHDEILNAGALPLDVLDARVTAWIAAKVPGKSGYR